MFDKLFKRTKAIERHRSAPLADERARFLEHLAARSYTRLTLVNYAASLIAIVRVLKPKPGTTRKQIRSAAFKYAPPYPDGRRCAHETFKTVAGLWLRFLGWLAPDKPPVPHGELVDRYAAYMRDERGFTELTIWHMCWNARRFLEWLDARGGKPQELTVHDLDAFVHWLGRKGMSRRSIGVRAKALRSFLKHGAIDGWCSPNLADAVASPRIYRQENLPTGPSWAEVARLLRSMDNDDPCDIRDRAIVLLFAVYGLRAGEVAVLRLDDIDWRNDQIRIRRPKVRRAHLYPLTSEVGQAIARYLKEVRPQSAHREVFLSMVAPYDPMTRFYRLVRKRFIALDIQSPKMGSHSLRHACATRLLDEGFSLKEIADHLGHRSLDSTRVYAKVDMKGLGEVATFDLGGLV